MIVYSAAKFPDNQKIVEIMEPWVKLNLISGEKYLGSTMKLLEDIRGRHLKTDYLGHGRIEIVYEAPLKEVIVDFYDRLKSITEGYGSMSYEIIGYRPGNLVKLDILIAGEANEALASIVPRERAYEEGRRTVSKLKELLPRQLFPVAIQAAIGGDIIARETLPALKKDVTGYLYGGDRTRKMKLWKKQQRGKKRLKERGVGSVEIPPDVFIKMLKK
jgi:GTP-binding protein LepA